MQYYLYRLAGFLCPLLPDRLGYWLCARAGDLAFFLTAKRQRALYSNLRHILGPEASQAQLDAVARRAFQSLIKNYYDLFRGPSLSPDKIRSQLAGLEGLEHMERALAQGKGVVAGSAHFGTWDMILHIAAIFLKTQIVVPNERLKPDKLFDYVMALRKSQGIDMVPVDLAPRLLIKALKAGHIAGIAYDRDITKSGPRVLFFGEMAQMPDGPVQLALKYGCPIIIGFSIRQPDNRSYVHIEPPLQFAKTGNTAEDIRTGVQAMAAVMERYIRQYPDQWVMFQPIWDTANEVDARG